MKHPFLIFLLGTTIFTGCAQKAPEPKLTPVAIAFQQWVGYGPFYLAQEKGFCKEEGIDLVFVDEQLDSARGDAFKQGMLDCEGGTIDLLVMKAAQNTPIVAVMELDQSDGADAIVASENIKTLEGLMGQTVAFARDDASETFLSALFYKKKLPFNNIVVAPASPEEVAQVFLDGKADACVTWEPQVSEALKRPGAHILASTKEHQGIIIDTLNVRKDLVEKNPVLVKKIMRVWFKALKYYEENPLKASEIIAKYYKITPEQYRKQVEGLRWDDYEEQKSHPEHQEWLKAFDTASEVKLTNSRISKKPDASKFINHTLLEKLYEDSE
jgi:NitT/TauT family transport system substrate-binding protein